MTTFVLALALAVSGIHGRVVDPFGAPIAGARVSVVSDDGRLRLSATTDPRGEFSLALEPGRYSLSAAADGFRPATQPLRVSGADSQLQDVVLEIAGVRESVTVSGTAEVSPTILSATKTSTPLRDVPQSVTVITREMINDQLMTSIADVVRYVPGITAHQGENNRDDVIIRGNRSSADFFINGVRDDVQYYRDLYNLDRVEALKGPNALIFGRGGAGGVVNRVAKEAVFQPLLQVALQGGAFGQKRLTADLGEALSGTFAFRLNGLFEESDSFRRAVGLERYGVTPTVTIVPNDRTRVVLRYEHLHDTRVADRGISSYQGRPVDVPIETFYGNPADSHVNLQVNLGSALVEHRRGGLIVRNQTVVAGYDRFYQNYVPGAVNSAATQVTLTAYNNATNRTNVFNQTDVTQHVTTGAIRHTVLVGAEIGRQFTDNFRNTGYFNNAASSTLVPFGAPTTTVPVTFRQSATDADNHLRTAVAAAYGQDQIEVSKHVQVVTGLRFDRFDLRYHNNRTSDTLERPDNLVSPRLGLVFKPLTPLSVYGSYSVSYLPSSGDQFSSLTTITQQVQPEKFSNYEVGTKWDLRPDLSFTVAVYRLDRTNTRSTDPNDPTRIVQTGSQRTNGSEVGVNGRITRWWTIAGGYANQDAFVTSATTAAPAGAQVGQVPHHTFSLWQQAQVHPRVAAALGIIRRSDMFATIDDSVTLPGYTRADAAVYVSLSTRVRLQANVENLFDRKYFVNADSNTNISPGFPRAIRIALTAAF